MLRSLFFGLVLLVMTGAMPARAQIEVYDLERPHTQVMFSVWHMGLSQSHGKFLDFNGQIVLNHDDKTRSSVTATIKTASLEMNDTAWNDHLKNADFFDVQKFPEMTFKSQSVTLTGEKTADVTGDLTLRGVTRPVTLHVTFNHAMQTPHINDYRAGFSATTTLKRSDFGLDKGIPLVSDEVKIMIEVEAIRQEPAAPKGSVS